MSTNPLLGLTPTQLHPIRGDRRQQLINYLRTWQEFATLLRYVEVWLGASPDLATLRQVQAEALLQLGQPEPALLILDALDAERGMTEGRRQLRLAAYQALERWADGHELIEAHVSDAEHAARLHGDLFVAQHMWAEAREAYLTAGIDADGSERPTLCAAQFALARGEQSVAYDIMQARHSLPDYQPRPNELRFEQILAVGLERDDLVAQIEADLLAREAEQRIALLTKLGLDEHDEVVVLVPVEATQASATVPEPTVVAGPPPAPVPPEAYELLQTHWGYGDFRGQQAAVVGEVLAGHNVLAVLPTGAGKSLCYQLPAFLCEGATVVVSPLIALMKDQLDGLPARLRPQATAINSSLRNDEVQERLQQVREGRFKLVYVAPERLRQQSFVHALRQAGIARFVVDEAHCVSLWGLSFRPDYLFLKRVLQDLGTPPVLALTATATPETQQEILAALGSLGVVTASVFRSNLHFLVEQVANKEEKERALIRVCKASDGAVVVYARARMQCEELADTLRRNGIKAAHYHAQVEDRSAVQEQFMRGEVRVLVATVAFGMGVDKADVRKIVHYNLPQSVEAYYQEAGRAGRDGLPAECVLLYTSSDKAQLVTWLRQDALHKDDLRAVYKLLRANAQQGFAALHTDVLLRDLPFLDETRLRVVLGMLERVGLIVRHFDLPRLMSATLFEPPDDPDFAHYADTVYLRPGQRVSFAPIETAVACGWRPDELEARLLQWQSDGVISYSGPATDLLLELLPAPPDTAERIDTLLVDYDNRQKGRIDAMVGYARGLNCRHRALAAHFGERLRACASSCDVCKGTVAPLKQQAAQSAPPRTPSGPALRGTAVAQAILRTIRDLPFQVGRTGLMKILEGASGSPIAADRCPDWGKLDSYSQKAITEFIDELIEHGLLARSDGPMPLVALTNEGYRALLHPTTLPDLAPEPVATAPVVGDDLYKALENWRRQVANDNDVPTYVVFNNATLHDIAIHRPRTLNALGAIKGVGPKKLDEYGIAVLQLIASHQ